MLKAQHHSLNQRFSTTCFASKVIIFQETLEYANVINICYTQQSSTLRAKVPSELTWAIVQTITETLNLVDHHPCWINVEDIDYYLRFPNVGLLAWQILGITRSQIETEQILSVASVLTGLWQCHLGVENLDKLIIIYKNWPSNAQLHCKLVDGDKLVKLFVTENKLLEGNEDLLENQAIWKR